MHRIIFLLFGFTFLFGRMHAASITGEVIDMEDRAALSDVTIWNIHTNSSAYTDSNGHFTIMASSDQLLEFKKLGYKTVRFRVPGGTIPPYFKIIMQKGPIVLPEFNIMDHERNYKKDSLEYYELYKNALEFPTLTGLDMIRHPFSALSKRNRQIWAFQKEYTVFEQQKYVDYTFNEKLITSLTGLTGDSLHYYMRRFRPTYEQLRGMNEYSFYSYIKEAAIFYRSGFRRRDQPSIRRSSQ